MKRWIVTFGTSTKVFYTEYHVDQFTRALDLNGTTYTVDAPVFKPRTFTLRSGEVLTEIPNK